MFVNFFAHRSDKVDELRGSNLVQGNEWELGTRARRRRRIEVRRGDGGVRAKEGWEVRRGVVGRWGGEWGKEGGGE